MTMRVLSPRPVALWQSCCVCGCLMAYDFEDIRENKYIYCPICKTKQLSNCDLSYDGVIKNDSTTKGKK